MQVKMVTEASVIRAIKEVKQQQLNIIAVNNAPMIQLNHLHREAIKLIGSVDTLRTLELLDDAQYQELVEQNTVIIEKLEYQKQQIKRALNSRPKQC